MSFTTTTITPTRLVFSSARPRRRPQAGDIKIMRGQVFVRQQVLYTGVWGGYAVRGGRPVYEWVHESRARDDYRTGWVQPKRKHLKPS